MQHGKGNSQSSPGAQRVPHMINPRNNMSRHILRRIWTEKLTRPINEGHHVLSQQFTFWPQDPFTEVSKEHLATCVIYLC